MNLSLDLQIVLLVNNLVVITVHVVGMAIADATLEAVAAAK